MRYEEFEKRLLKLAFETEVRLTEASVAYHLGCGIGEAKQYLEKMLDAGALELESDERGNLFYLLPDRPEPPHAAPALPVLPAAGDGPWRLALVLNLVWPGAGTLLAGRPLPAAGQAVLSLAPILLLIAFWKDFGDREHKYKLALLVASYVGAWLWALGTSLRIRRDSREPEGAAAQEVP